MALAGWRPNVMLEEEEEDELEEGEPREASLASRWRFSCAAPLVLHSTRQKQKVAKKAPAARMTICE